MDLHRAITCASITEKLPSSSIDNVPMTSAAQMIARPEASATTFSPILNSFPSLPIKILSTTQGKPFILETLRY